MSQDFWQLFRGRFSGLLNWSDVDALLLSLKTDNSGWFVFDMETPIGLNPDLAPVPPQSVADEADFLRFLGVAKDVIYKRRSRPNCGAVYVDDPKVPTFIKIFDPAKMGTSCSISSEPVLPRWTVTRIKPVSLPQKSPDLSKQGFFARLTGKGRQV